MGEPAANMHPLELGISGTELRRSLVAGVLRGDKLATASLRLEYEPDTIDPLPRVGERLRLLGYDDEVVGIVETTEVLVLPVSELDVGFVRDEGEGFDSIVQWRVAHKRFWRARDLLPALTDYVPVVCERFRLLCGT